MNRCLCKKEISEWLFCFSPEMDKFEKDNDLGIKVKVMLLKIKKSYKSRSIFETLLSNIEHKVSLRNWFLKEIEKISHKRCYGWQCKFKVLKINKKCNIHGKRIKIIK